MISKVTLANAAGEDIVLHEVASTAKRVATSIEGLQGIGALRSSKRVRPSAHGSLNETSWEEGRQPQFVLEVSGTSMENAWEEFRAVTRVCLETLDSGAALLKWTEGTAGNKLQMLVKLDSMVEPIILGGVGTLLSFPVSFFGADPRAYAQTQTEATGGTITGAAAELEFVKSEGFNEGVAVDATFIYWQSKEAIGRAKLNGTVVEPQWLKLTGQTPASIRVDASHIYWRVEGTNKIGRAAIGGTSVEPEWVKPTIGGSGVFVATLAVDSAHIYWVGGNSSRAVIGRAAIGGTSVEPEWIPTLGARSQFTSGGGLAVDASHVYWGTRSAGIGRASISGGEVTEGWIKGAAVVTDMVVTATFVYWTSASGKAVGRAKVNGTEVTQALISGLTRPGALAVDGSHLYWGEETSLGGGYEVARSASLSGGAIGSTLVITQAGNRPTPMTFRIHGPILNPSIVNAGDGSRISLTGSVTAGNYLEVNTAERRILLNGATLKMGFLNAGATNWSAFAAPGGGVSATYSLTGTEATAAFMDAIYRSAYA